MSTKTMLAIFTALALFTAVPTGAFARGGGHSGGHDGSHFGDGSHQHGDRDSHDGFWPYDPFGFDQSCYQTGLYPWARDRHTLNIEGCYN
jgi:hypothetical protein